MRTTRIAAIAIAPLLAAALTLPLTTSQATAAPPQGAPSEDSATSTSDSLTTKWREKYDARRDTALQQRLRTGGVGATEKLAKGVYGKVAETGGDRIFAVLAEFGNTRHSAFPDSAGDATTYEGPLHNKIPRPNRAKDNSTVWRSDYNRAHYQNIYFTRMKKFYEDQSSGRYTFNGDVTEWVKVPFNEARYGRNTCGSNVCNNTWFLIRDALAEWTKSKVDAGWSTERIQAYLKTFDKQDRYDFDGDGDFNEPDGYIDHFQIVHAGGDEADGDPIQGGDAIWSHRWNAQIEPYGTGPVGGAQIGGVNIGQGGPSDGGAVQIPNNPTGVWVNDYTIQPENGGLSVFAHEFAHDLGLPDLYDTSGNSGGAENSVGFWSLMSQSRGTAKTDPGIGDRPMPFGAWDKFQLGWLRYNVVRAGNKATFNLQPGQKVTKRGKNGSIVLLPDKHVPLDLGAPCGTCGSKYYYSGSGNELDNTMTTKVTGGGALTAKVRYDIEEAFDYAYLQYTNDGETWTNLPTSESYTGEDQSGTNDGTGISASSGGAWVDLTATVPTDATGVRWRYVTDTAAVEPGFQVDNITLAGASIGDAETGGGWTFDGFRVTTGTEDQKFLNAYFVDNRQYVGSDNLLKHLYQFAGYANRPDWVDFFRNGSGALISYWDTSYQDNNVGEHPGGGQILPVDAHPEFQHTPDGALARPRLLTFDSAFSLKPNTTQKLHFAGKRWNLKGSKAQPVFNDLRDWWYDGDEHTNGVHTGHYQPGWYGVDVPRTGTTIKVVKVAKSGVMTVQVGTAR